MSSLDVFGTLLLAPEGINGTVAGTRHGIDAFLDSIRSDPRLADIEVKESRCAELPFKRCRVRLKREIVTMGVDGNRPERCRRYLCRSGRLEPADRRSRCDADRHAKRLRSGHRDF